MSLPPATEAWTDLVWGGADGTAFAFDGDTYVQDGVADGDGFLAAGYTIDGDVVTGRIWRSPEGETWDLEDGDWFTGVQFDHVLRFGSGFVIVGAHRQSGPAVWWSSDGATWEERTPAGFEYLAFDDAAAGPSGVLLSARGRAGDYWFLGDADLHWTRLDAAWPDGVRIFSIAWGGAGWIATGAAGAGTPTTIREGGTVGAIWTSPDASTWTPMPVDRPGGVINDVRGVGGGYLAIGSDVGLQCDGCLGGPIVRSQAAVTWFSPDGQTWQRTGELEVGVLRVGDAIIIGGPLTAGDGSRLLAFDSLEDGRLRVRQTMDGLTWADVRLLYTVAVGAPDLDRFPDFGGPVLIGPKGIVVFSYGPDDPDAVSRSPVPRFASAAEFPPEGLPTFPPRPRPIVNDFTCPNQEPCGP
jgi:hypothetical protein